MFRFEIKFQLDGSETLVYLNNLKTGNIIAPNIGELAGIALLILDYSYPTYLSELDLEQANNKINNQFNWSEALDLIHQYMAGLPLRKMLQKQPRGSLDKSDRAFLYLLSRRIFIDFGSQLSLPELNESLSDFSSEKLAFCAKSLGEDWINQFLFNTLTTIFQSITRLANELVEV